MYNEIIFKKYILNLVYKYDNKIKMWTHAHKLHIRFLNFLARKMVGYKHLITS